MKLKLVSLGLLALAPMAAQAELVELQDAEMSDVSGQAWSFSGDFDVSVYNAKLVKGYLVEREVYAAGYVGSSAPDYWELGGSKEVTSFSSGRWFNKSIAVGKEYGETYVSPTFSWGRNFLSI